MEAIDHYELKFVKVFRIFALGRLEIVFIKQNKPLWRAIFTLAFQSITIIFIFASGMLLLENRLYFQVAIEFEEAAGNKDHGIELLVFHDLIYYTVVSITTTGYGDISP